MSFEFGEAFQFDWSEEGLLVGGVYGNPPVKALSGEVEISRREFLHEEVKIFGQPDHGGAQAR
jgi:hypothetical protein